MAVLGTAHSLDGPNLLRDNCSRNLVPSSSEGRKATCGLGFARTDTWLSWGLVTHLMVPTFSAIIAVEIWSHRLVA